MIDFSVIIPHSNSLSTLGTLISSIPENNKIEVIVVDNSSSAISVEDVVTERDFRLLYSEPTRGAGGARNVGIENAKGKWIVFADADDFFTENAFDIFYSQYYSEADVVYTLVDSIFLDTREHANRGDLYNNLVIDYLSGKIDEKKIRIEFNVPWGKMIKKSFILNNNFRFDEVPASNDIYIGMLVGVNSNKIGVVSQTTYVVTTHYASLTQLRNLAVLESRYTVLLRYNKYLREHNLSNYQSTNVARYLYMSLSYGIVTFLRFIKMAFRYKQNIFIGFHKWIGAYKRFRQDNKIEKKYRAS